jgi:NADPH-ferrihemoprotein reductase
MVNKRLQALGAERFHTYGEGDDDGTLEDDFDAWKETLWPVMVTKFVGAGATVAKRDEMVVPDLKPSLRLINLPTPTAKQQERAKSLVKTAKSKNKHFFECVELKVTENRELRQDTKGGSTIHLELDCNSSSDGLCVSYQTADNLAIVPDNDPQLVESVAKWMSFDLDSWFQLEAIEGEYKPPFPTPCSVRQMLTQYMDLNCVPKRSLMPVLAAMAEKSQHREQLLCMGSKSKEGRELYSERVGKRQTTLTEMFEMFPSIQPSVASKSLDPHTLTILVASDRILLVVKCHFQCLPNISQNLRLGIIPFRHLPCLNQIVFL